MFLGFHTGALSDRQHGDDGKDPEYDAQHRQSGSQLVKQQAFECKLHCTKQSGHARIILSITVSALEDPFTGNKTIFHEDLAFGDLGNIWFVGHHQNRASLGIQILQNCHDL